MGHGKQSRHSNQSKGHSESVQRPISRCSGRSFSQQSDRSSESSRAGSQRETDLRFPMPTLFTNQLMAKFNMKGKKKKLPLETTTTYKAIKDVNSKSARVLAIVVVPGHLLFLYTIHLLQGGHTAMRPTFIICYLSAALLQVVILLYVASLMVRWLWRRGLDNFSIPYLTALGDLLGTSFLALSFRLILMLKPLGHLLTVSLMLSQHLCSSLPCLTSHSKTNFRGDANAMNWSFW
ncbi:solute carrier family 41 member 1-like isoform X1 [Siniperca chuatsi]|uniref:solute carrier family 41 member 1-like isoform X1 n=1 Tax=Siniperca chuatsi TaxID=119488 RepID=UPI001CE150D3|nr:solute carrier family 41 member 1-like isoform X1 [Siniperca chuatsi]XP_044038334.1 solute carrier family 41 member 1-like isoform X1 [Siniperca chuatsi]XP_044038343.1 solute carrier family 41 member 1-like isoform X1 [Siniperca chuatsi]XP_044038351.1 solute carrier family 41 member 1-like isoform X1 [Siniperca chuatsi]XP_044038361.1 solute carrier family 41 member 1-like isoform X1 [Siniperca chuatsi]XP_044038370.1 solute carrier family 41 member 1-like isoform X1 [Siniperca chuatsi]XP_04